MKIALIGYGKMGHAIEEIAIQRGHEIILTIDHDNLSDFTEEKLSTADVAIEFTGPETAFENVNKCLEWGIPVVCGSTGWTDRLEPMKDKCIKQEVGFAYSSNFSIGVNIFFEVNKRLAELMSPRDEYEVKLEETHHTQKKDAPSGTAISLAEQILEKITRKKKWVNERSEDGANLEILSHRIDPAPGTHTINYSSPVDSISITHSAHNRKGFASGAVLAAEFIKDKKGFFTMKEVLHL